MSNPIVAENLNTGTTSWKFTATATTEIQAYANVTSVDPGGSIVFYVSTQVASTTYTIKIFRLGWYGGTGGCLKATISGQVGVAQGYWDGTTLQNCPTAISTPSVHLLEAGWAASYTWAVPSNACTGIYLAQFTDANGKQWAYAFVVRGNPSADYVVVRPYTTDAAYNDWGGYSLYTSPGMGVKVSFNRPFTSGGTSGLFAYELPAIHWLESQGYNLAYLSDIDLHTSGTNPLLTHGAYLSLGHDEYWTKEMRTNVEAALAAGLGLGFLGANACYWQCRLENDAASNANRTLVCYKVSSSPSTLTNDPQYTIDVTRVSAQWRDPVLDRPENALIGIMYWDDVQTGNGPWTVDAAATSPYLAGTGLLNNTSYGTDLVGYEWDKSYSAPSGPNNLQVIGTSAMTGVTHGAGVSNTTTYVAASGALVFASGSISWTWCLDTFRPTGSAVVIPGMQALFTNIMRALLLAKKPTGFSSFAAYRS